MKNNWKMMSVLVALTALAVTVLCFAVSANQSDHSIIKEDIKTAHKRETATEKDVTAIKVEIPRIRDDIKELKGELKEVRTEQRVQFNELKDLVRSK